MERKNGNGNKIDVRAIRLRLLEEQAKRLEEIARKAVAVYLKVL